MSPTKSTKTLSLASRLRKQYLDDLIQAGFRLFPLTGKSKVPAVEGFPHLPYDPLLSASDFPANVGVSLKETDLVIDVDPRKFTPGDNPMARLAEYLGVFGLDTYTVQSPAGGVHIYLKKPAGINIKKTHGAYVGLDFLSAGAFCVAPGSVNKSNIPYKPIKGTPDQRMDAPERLLELIQRAVHIDGDGLSQPIDDDATTRRFMAYLATAEGATQGEYGDTATYKIACKGRDFGLSEAKTFQMMADHWNMKCSPPWSMAELSKKVENAYGYALSAPGSQHPEADFEPIVDCFDDDRSEAEAQMKGFWNFSTDKEGRKMFKADIVNIANHFKIPDYKSYRNPLNKLIRYNAFSQHIEFAYPAPWHTEGTVHPHWTDTDAIMLKAYLCELRGWHPSVNLIHEAVVKYAYSNAYHPVRDYFNSLEWDGIERLSTLFPYYTNSEDNPYTRAVSRLTMIAAVARIMKPGVKHDCVPVLEGKQGTGKSTFCRTLGKSWHADIHLDPHNKDTVMYIQGKLVVEISEMICTKKSDANSIKSFLSMEKDTIRLPYGRNQVDIPRQCIFIGTINPEGEYLKDKTGNRRWLPIATHEMRIAELRRDVDQLWAEAVVAFDNGEAFHIEDKEILQLAEHEQYARQEKESWSHYIEDWLLREENRGELHPVLTTQFIIGDVLNIPVRDTNRHTHVRVADAMRELGWEQSRVYEGGARLRCYRNPALEVRPNPDWDEDFLDGL